VLLLGYRELFEATVALCDYMPVTNTLCLKQDSGTGLKYNDVEGKLVLGYGYTFDELSSLEKLVDEDVIRMHQELSEITPQDFKSS
jgi:hypothetical protein